ncbi:hypothetical protein ACFL24_00850 [Patescibacteria group bacterium]
MAEERKFILLIPVNEDGKHRTDVDLDEVGGVLLNAGIKATPTSVQEKMDTVFLIEVAGSYGGLEDITDFIERNFGSA